MHRSIVLAKGGRYWVYAHLFAKNDCANIEADELLAFRELAGLFAKKTDADISHDLEIKELTEICHDQA